MSEIKQISIKINEADFEKALKISNWRIEKGLSRSMSDFAKQCFLAAINSSIEKPLAINKPKEEAPEENNKPPKEENHE